MNKKYSNIDDLFRDKFKNFELYPPEHIWENVKQKIQTQETGQGGKNISNSGIIGITILLILTSMTLIYFLQNRVDINPKNKAEVPHASSDNSYKSTPRSADYTAIQGNKSETITEENKIKKQASTGKKKTANRFDLINNGPIEKGKTDLTVDSDKSNSNSINKVQDYKTISDPDNGAEFLMKAGLFVTPGDDSDLLAYNNTTESVSEKTEQHNKEFNSPVNKSNPVEELNSSSAPNPEIVSDYGRKGNWSFGLFFTPEMIYYPSASEFNSRNYSLDLNAIYSFSGFQIQSGLGACWSSDNGNYRIGYNKYLGSYNDVYDITFDTINGKLSPVYHTQIVSVYDSIDHLTITPTKRKFTYLDVPLLIGYGNEGRRFGWSVKAGPSVSFLIHENIPDINLTDSQNKILNVENEIPGRLKTNWQFVLVGGVSYKLSNSLDFRLEPVFRYYINSAYEQNNISSKSPYSIGLRAGFVLGF